MGCGSSAQAADETSVCAKDEGEPEKDSFLTHHQKDLIRSTWSQFKEGSYIEDATYIFVVLFREMPETIKLFHFLSGPTEEELLTNPLMEKHVERVVNTIGLAVDHLDDQEILTRLTNDLGRRHVSFGAEPVHLDAVINGVMYSLQRKLPEAMTDDANQAWLGLMSFIGSNMVEGMNFVRQQEAEGTLRSHQSSSV